MTHGEATPKPSNLNDNVVDDSSCFEFNFDIKPFEDHLNNSTSHLKDDFSHSSCLSETSSSEFSSLKWIDDLLEEAHARLDKKIDAINDSFLAPSHTKGRCDNECARASSAESLSFYDIDFYPNISSEKDSLDNSIHEESSFASNNMHFEPHPLEDSFILCL